MVAAVGMTIESQIQRTSTSERINYHTDIKIIQRLL